VTGEHGIAPEEEVLLADSVRLALLVVIETLTPAERLAFVLDDMFAVSFEEIAAMLRGGDFDRLVALLDPDVVLNADGVRGATPASLVLRGAQQVARASLAGARSGWTVRPALVNGTPGAVLFDRGRPASIMGFTVVGGKIVEIDALSDSDRLQALDLTDVAD
jgi:hypothetical protein